MIIKVTARGIATFVAWVIVALSLANLGVQVLHYGFGYPTVMGLNNAFNVDSENSVPTWWSAAQLCFCAGLLATIALKTRSIEGPKGALPWWGLAIVFVGLSIEEIAMFHEHLGTALGSRVRDALGLSAEMFAYWWVLPGMAAVVVFSLAFFRFFFRLPASSRRSFATAAIVFVSGAIGVEILGGLYFAAHGRDLTMELLCAVEEFLEMAGIALFATALAAHIETEHGGIRVVLQVGERPRSAEDRVVSTASRSYDDSEGLVLLGHRAK